MPESMFDQTELSNCLGFVYFKLGLSDEDVGIEASDFQDILRDFDIAEEKVAQALAFTFSVGKGQTAREVLAHIAYISPGNPEQLIHRSGYHMPVETVSKAELYAKLPGQDYDRRFLKVKNRGLT